MVQGCAIKMVKKKQEENSLSKAHSLRSTLFNTIKEKESQQGRSSLAPLVSQVIRPVLNIHGFLKCLLNVLLKITFIQRNREVSLIKEMPGI